MPSPSTPPHPSSSVFIRVHPWLLTAPALVGRGSTTDGRRWTPMPSRSTRSPSEFIRVHPWLLTAPALVGRGSTTDGRRWTPMPSPSTRSPSEFIRVHPWFLNAPALVGRGSTTDGRRWTPMPSRSTPPHPSSSVFIRGSSMRPPWWDGVPPRMDADGHRCLRGAPVRVHPWFLNAPALVGRGFTTDRHRWTPMPSRSTPPHPSSSVFIRGSSMRPPWWDGVPPRMDADGHRCLRGAPVRVDSCPFVVLSRALRGCY